MSSQAVPEVAEGTQMESFEDREFVQEIESALPPASGVVGEAEARVDYLLERLSSEHARIERVRGAAKLRIEMIRANEAEELRKLEGRVAWLEQKIRDHVPGDGARFKAVYGKKSLSMAAGEVGFKQHPASIEITNPARALGYAKEHGLEIKVTESVNKTPLKEHVIRTGIEPDAETDGFAFIPARDEFFASPRLGF